MIFMDFYSTENFYGLRKRVKEMMEKLSLKKIREQMKKFETAKLDTTNATIKIKTSIERKKKQLQIDGSVIERNIDDSITNAM